MEKQGSGKILNTSSIRGWEQGGRAIVYSAAKAGINSLRRQTGYDESAKCRVCGRALDDEAVTCRADYCAETGAHL